MINKTEFIVDSNAKISNDVKIGPWSIIGPNVEIESGCVIGSHVVIEGNTKIGRNTKIHSHAVIGGEAQALKRDLYPDGSVLIGENNCIREYVTINRGFVTDSEDGRTVVGDNNLIMAYSHVAHDCKLGNNIIMSNGVQLAGHVKVQDYAILSGMVLVHQFCHLGAHSFLSGRAAIVKDILPYTLVAGSETTTRGLNIEGLKRRGFSRETLRALREAYKIIFRSSNLLENKIKNLEPLALEFAEVRNIINFLNSSVRGILRSSYNKNKEEAREIA